VVFVRNEFRAHNAARLEDSDNTGYVCRIRNEYLEIRLVGRVEAIERNAFNEEDGSDVL